jgi:hypothetical protein
MAAASAERVRSSSVGPRPPVRMMSCAAAARRLIAVARAVSSSGTVACSMVMMPAEVRRSASQRELELRVWPRVSSSPTEMIAERSWGWLGRDGSGAGIAGRVPD